MKHLLNEIKSQLFDAPAEVKSSFNEVVKYFANEKDSSKKDLDDAPEFIKEMNTLVKNPDALDDVTLIDSKFVKSMSEDAGDDPNRKSEMDFYKAIASADTLSFYGGGRYIHDHGTLKKSFGKKFTVRGKERVPYAIYDVVGVPVGLSDDPFGGYFTFVSKAGAKKIVDAYKAGKLK